MNLSFYTAAVGAGQQQQRLNVQGNNIANLNTTAFKSKRPSFSSLLYNNIVGAQEAELPRGSGARLNMAENNFAGGPTLQAAIGQSYSINGRGFFALTDMATGEVTYTRDGSFTLSETTRLNEEGLPEQVFHLSDGEGRLVLSRAGTVIEVTDFEEDQPVGIFDFVNINGMQNVGANRFTPVEKNGQVRMGTGTLQRGVLEASNTDLASELAQVIEAQRSFSYALKMVQTSDELETTVNGLRG